MIGLSVPATVLLLAGLAITAGMVWTFASPALRERIEALLSAGLLAFCLTDLLLGSRSPWISAGIAAGAALHLLGCLASLWRTRKASQRAEPTA